MCEAKASHSQRMWAEVSSITPHFLHNGLSCGPNRQRCCLRVLRPVSRPINPLNPELNPICYLLALLAHHFLHVSRIRVKSLTLRLLMSYIYIYIHTYIYIYIYGAPILDVSRSHTTTQHSHSNFAASLCVIQKHQEQVLHIYMTLVA